MRLQLPGQEFGEEIGRKSVGRLMVHGSWFMVHGSWFMVREVF
jgi:hypothetical protein